MKILFSFCAITLIYFSALPASSQETDKAEYAIIFNNMSRAYGFCKGQSFSLNRIQSEFPELRNPATIAQLEWSTVFGRSCETLEDRLGRVLADKWIAFRDRMLSAATESLAKTQLSRDTAIEFLEIVKKRAKGDIHPQHLKHF